MTAENTEHNGVVKMQADLETVKAVIKDELKPLVTTVAVHGVKIAFLCWIVGAILLGILGVAVDGVFGK